MTNDDIITWDDLHNMMTLYKTNIDTCEFPLVLNRTLDIAGNYAMSSYDTLAYVNPNNIGPYYVVNGKVTFSHMNDTDRAFVTMMNRYYSEGLLDPNFSAYTSNNDYRDQLTTGKTGLLLLSPGDVDGLEATTTNDADVRWEPIRKPMLYPDQTLHIGAEMSRIFYGSSVISAKCENIPLAVSWCDWRYSTSGAFIMSFGPEGLLWERDTDGKIFATDFAINHPDGLAYSWCTMLYGLNALTEHGMVDQLRRFIIPNGERYQKMSEYWGQYNYDGAYKWPAGAKLNDEQLAEVNKIANDLATFTSENYLAFIDGSKSLDEWDSYVDTLNSIGMSDVIAIYQSVYDNFMEG